MTDKELERTHRLFELEMRELFGDSMDLKRAKNDDQSYMNSDTLVAWKVWLSQHAKIKEVREKLDRYEDPKPEALIALAHAFYRRLASWSDGKFPVKELSEYQFDEWHLIYAAGAGAHALGMEWELGTTHIVMPIEPTDLMIAVEMEGRVIPAVVGAEGRVINNFKSRYAKMIKAAQVKITDHAEIQKWIRKEKY